MWEAEGDRQKTKTDASVQKVHGDGQWRTTSVPPRPTTNSSSALLPLAVAATTLRALGHLVARLTAPVAGKRRRGPGLVLLHRRARDGRQLVQVDLLLAARGRELARLLLALVIPEDGARALPGGGRVVGGLVAAAAGGCGF